MRTLTLLLYFITVNVCSQNIEIYSVNKTNSEINIDGYLDEVEWAVADTTNHFVILGDTLNSANAPTWAKMLWDNNYLFVAFYCEDPKIWATYKNQDDPLYKEDVVEVYIDPDGDGENYIEVEINPLNTIFDLWLTKPRKQGGDADVSWTLNGLKSAISVKGTISNNSDVDSSWICEMALPFSEMKLAAPSMNYPPNINDKWRFNLYRFDRSSTNNSTGEATGWSQTEGGQHEPDNFGEITFGGLISDLKNTRKKENFGQNIYLQQNYPNPFNLSTNILFSITKSERMSLKIYDMLRQHVRTLFDNTMPAGLNVITWDGKDESGENLKSDGYLCQLKSDYNQKTLKMILLK